ncbi:MAG: hypothetical protein AAF614_27390, partial [Chloroflexota bacterium]
WLAGLFRVPRSFLCTHLVGICFCGSFFSLLAKLTRPLPITNPTATDLSAAKATCLSLSHGIFRWQESLFG